MYSSIRTCNEQNSAHVLQYLALPELNLPNAQMNMRDIFNAKSR